MPRAARSQPSQSQPRATQSRRRRAQVEDDDEEQVDATQDAMDVEDDDGDTGEAGVEITRKANDLVRLALFAEQRRAALRRDEINKKVLGSNTRTFNAVFLKAREILTRRFGMDLVELHKGVEVEETDKQTAETTGLKKKSASTGLKTCILRSTLDPALIEQASVSHAEILEEEQLDAPEADSDDEGIPQPYGSILNWTGSDQVGAVGILHVVLALIMVHGRVISDTDLQTHLKRLGLQPGAFIPTNVLVTQRSNTVEAYLKDLDRQGYLLHLEVGGAGKAGAGKRARGGAGASQHPNGEAGADAKQFEWRWGPRAIAEIGEQAVARFVADFMVERRQEVLEVSSDEDEGLGRRRERGRGGRDNAEARMEKMLKGIETAAGGTLQDVR